MDEIIDKIKYTIGQYEMGLITEAEAKQHLAYLLSQLL
jgi:hypothetical protein